jgi:hypothetical protein
MFPELIQKLIKGSVKEIETLDQKWIKTIESAFFRATSKIRIAAFILGFLWGILLFLLIKAL